MVIDLGSGAHRINSDVEVKPNTWYQYIVERTGKHVKLTIREDVGGGKDVVHVKEEVIPGESVISKGEYPHKWLQNGSFRAIS